MNSVSLRQPIPLLLLLVILCSTLYSTINACSAMTCPSGLSLFQAYAQTFNGCGSGKMASITPQLSFQGCCNNHDKCYGTCGSSKSNCDSTFQTCMKRTCRSGILGLPCRLAADAYFQAVKTFGCNPFQNAQQEKCKCRKK